MDKVINQQYLKFFFLILFGIVFYLNIQGQEAKETSEYNTSSLLFNIAGDGGFGAIHCQHSFLHLTNSKFSYSLGLGLMGFYDQKRVFNPNILVPIGFLYEIGKQRIAILGVKNIISSIVKSDRVNFLPKRYYDNHLAINIGYRHHLNEKRIFLEILYTPIIQNYQSFRHWGAFGLGYQLHR